MDPLAAEYPWGEERRRSCGWTAQCRRWIQKLEKDKTAWFHDGDWKEDCRTLREHMQRLVRPRSLQGERLFSWNLITGYGRSSCWWPTVEPPDGLVQLSGESQLSLLFACRVASAALWASFASTSEKSLYLCVLPRSWEHFEVGPPSMFCVSVNRQLRLMVCLLFFYLFEFVSGR